MDKFPNPQPIFMLVDDTGLPLRTSTRQESVTKINWPKGWRVVEYTPSAELARLRKRVERLECEKTHAGWYGMSQCPVCSVPDDTDDITPREGGSV